MPDALYTKTLFLESLSRCEQSPTFVEDFYTLLTSMSPTARDKFAKTDIQLHRVKLLRSLKTLASAVSGEPAALEELASRAETHSRDHMNITPDLYELWSSALITTARRYDSQWSRQTEDAWTHTLDILVQYMIKRY